MNSITTQRKGYDMAGQTAKTATGKGLTRKAAAPPPIPQAEEEYEEQPPEVEEAPIDDAPAEEEYVDTPPEGDTQEGDGEEEPPLEEEAPAPAAASNQAKTEDYMAQQERLLLINETNLQSEFVHQAAHYFKAAKNYYKAEAVLRQQKDILTDITSKKDADLRSTGEKVTEAYIDKAIKGDPQVQAQMAVINKATLQVGLHMANMHAWGHKKDMLIQVGVLQRAEWSGGPQVNKNSTDQQRPAAINGRPTRL